MPYHTGKGSHSKGMKKSKMSKMSKPKKKKEEEEINGQGCIYFKVIQRLKAKTA